MLSTLFQAATGYKRIANSQLTCIVNKHNDNLDYLWDWGENSESYMCEASILPPSCKPSRELFFNGVLSTTALMQYWTQSKQYTSQIVHYSHYTDAGNKLPTEWTCIYMSNSISNAIRKFKNLKKFLKKVWGLSLVSRMLAYHAQSP